MDERELNRLAEAFRRGDQRSFKTLVQALSRTLMAMAFRYTGDWEWARDLTQDSWIRVHDRIRSYDPNRSFTSWLHSVHRNVCLDHVRKPWVKRETAPGEEVIDRLSGQAEGGPEQELEKREFHDRLIQAAQELSETQRQVFLRVDLEQGNQKEVARALGIKFGTLRTTLHFARKRIAAALRKVEATW